MWSDPLGLLDPNGGFGYNKDDYNEGKSKISDALQKERGESKANADAHADKLMKEMGLLEAKKLKDMSKDLDKNKDAMKKLLADIDSRCKK